MTATNDGPVYIIGAGITGMGAAHYLRKKDVASVIVEQSRSLGGRAGYIERGETVIEVGGKNFNSGWKLFTELLADLNITEFDGQHSNFPMLLNERLFILDKRNKLKLVLGLLRRLGPRGLFQFIKFMSFVDKNRHRLNYDGGLIEDLERRYDAEPLSRHFAHGVAYGPLRLFSIIMSASEPDETFYSTLALLIAGQPGTSHAIRGGTKLLFERMAAGHDIRFGKSVKKIVIENNEVSGLLLACDGAEERVMTSAVVSAVPLHALARLIDFPAEILQDVQKISYMPVTLINAEYDSDVFNDEITSVFFDTRYHLGHCSANRNNRKSSVRYMLSGGRSRNLSDRKDDYLVALAERELSTVLPVTAKLLSYHVQRYEHGMCAYCAHFTSVKKKILDFIGTIKGLEIAGDYLNGHHLEGCLLSAKKAADAVLAERN